MRACVRRRHRCLRLRRARRVAAARADEIAVALARRAGAATAGRLTGRRRTGRRGSRMAQRWRQRPARRSGRGRPRRAERTTPATARRGLAGRTEQHQKTEDRSATEGAYVAATLDHRAPAPSRHRASRQRRHIDSPQQLDHASRRRRHRAARAETNAMTPQRSAAGLASHSQTAGRRIGPARVGPVAAPVDHQQATGATRAPPRTNRSSARSASARPRPCSRVRASTACAPARSSRTSFERHVRGASRDRRRPSARRRTRRRRRRRSAVCGVARRRGSAAPTTRASRSRKRTRAAHRLGERLVVVATRPSSSPRSPVGDIARSQSLRNASTTWLTTLPFGSRRPRSSTPSKRQLRLERDTGVHAFAAPLLQHLRLSAR